MVRVLILANPIAGNGRALRRADGLRDELTARGAEVTLHPTTSFADLVAHAGASSATEIDVVVPVGGDGTVRAVAGALPIDSPMLALMPSGTGNVLARELALPTRPAQVAQAILDGHSIPLPVFEADGTPFLQFLGAGVDAAMVLELESSRRGPLLGRIGWVWPVLRVAARRPRTDLCATLDDGRTVAGLSQVLVTRIRNYGGVFRLPPEVAPSSGSDLHLLCFHQSTRWQWLRTALRAWWSGLRSGRDCELHQTRSLSITAATPAATQIDGDSLGTTPVRIGPADRPPLRLAVPADHPALDAGRHG